MGRQAPVDAEEAPVGGEDGGAGSGEDAEGAGDVDPRAGVDLQHPDVLRDQRLQLFGLRLAVPAGRGPEVDDRRPTVGPGSEGVPQLFLWEPVEPAAAVAAVEPRQDQGTDQHRGEDDQGQDASGHRGWGALRLRGLEPGRQDPGAVQVQEHEAERAEVERGVQHDHQHDQQCHRPTDDGEAEPGQGRRGDPDHAAHHPGDAACRVVLDALPSRDQVAWLEHAPGELPHQVGRPPETPDQHDPTRQQQQDRAEPVSEQESRHDQAGHRPLMDLPRGDVENLGHGARRVIQMEQSFYSPLKLSVSHTTVPIRRPKPPSVRDG